RRRSPAPTALQRKHPGAMWQTDQSLAPEQPTTPSRTCAWLQSARQLSLSGREFVANLSRLATELPLHGLGDRVTHLGSRDGFLAGPRDIGRAQAELDGVVDGALYSDGFPLQAERVAEQQS